MKGNRSPPSGPPRLSDTYPRAHRSAPSRLAFFTAQPPPCFAYPASLASNQPSIGCPMYAAASAHRVQGAFRSPPIIEPDR
jgi:hypothetical protein